MRASGTVAVDGSPLISIDTFTFWLASGDAKAVADFFQGMTEKERRAYIKPLRDFPQAIGSRAMENERWYEYQVRRQHAARTLVPAAMAVLSTAGAVAKFVRGLQRARLFDPGEGGAVQQVLTDRAPAWLADLPAALLATMEPEGAIEVLEAVAEVVGVKVVMTRELVRAWAVGYRGWGTDEKLKAAILADPRLGEVLPMVFDDDENDYLFSEWSVFRSAVGTVAAPGRVLRGEVLDASLRRLLRGGRLSAMQDHLAFWNSLEAVDGEVLERVSSCISLLSSQNGTVARTFLAALKAVSDHGLLDVELAVEAASIAVTRSEKNVVKTALGWLDSLAARHPDRVGEIVVSIGAGFGAQAADLQERAVKLVGKHGRGLGEDERGRLVAEAGGYLAADLVATLAGLLGVSQGSLIGGYPEVAPYVPRPLLPPIGSPAEVAEVVASLMHADPVEAMVFERVLEAIVAFDRADSAALREAMGPVVERWAAAPWRWEQTVLTPRNALIMVATAAAGVDEDTRRASHRASVQALWLRARTSNPDWYRQRRTTPADFLILRAAEVHAALGMPELPPLVSVPTSPSGFIAPEALAARLRECEAQGWAPLDADFHQALLRLPEDCGGVDVSGLTSEAGMRFAAWAAGERIALPEADIPEPKAREQARDGSRAETGRLAASDHAVAPGTLLDLAPGVWREPGRCWDGSDWMTCWPAIVPSRPDLAAMAMIGGADWATAPAPASPESAVVLAEQEGAWGAALDRAPGGAQDARGGAPDGMHRVMAARLASNDVHLRASGVDAALVLAARGLLNAASLGSALADEMDAGTAGLRRAVPALRDLANGGAAAAVWEALVVVLPRVLPPAVPKTLAGTADLLVLGTELADALGVRTPIAEVDALARRKSGGAVANAARRLEAVLRAG